MAFTDALSGFWSWTKKASATVPIKLNSMWGGGDISPPSGQASFLRKYVSDPWINRAVRVIGETIGGCPHRVVGPNGDELKEHPCTKLINFPNPEQAQIDFFHEMFVYMECGGEDFWEIVPDKLGTKFPRELYNMKPTRVSLVPNENKTGIAEYLYGMGNTEESFEPDQVVHVKYVNPSDDWRGLPTIEPLSEIINADIYGWRWIRRFLKNFGILEGYFSPNSRIGEVARKRLAKQWKQGKGEEGIPMMPYGFDFNDMSRPPKESGLLDIWSHMVQSKLSVLGVPPALAGLVDSAKYASYDVQLKAFFTVTIGPKLSKVESAVNRRLMPIWEEGNSKYKGARFEFDRNAIGMLDVEVLVRVLNSMSDRGALSPNEMIEVLGYGDKYDGGDVHVKFDSSSSPPTELSPTSDEENSGE